MSRAPHWGWGPARPPLLWCAIGRHRWGMYCARAIDAPRDTHRECLCCGLAQQRADAESSWEVVR